MDSTPAKPPVPELPTYVRDPLENQSPERLDLIAEYTEELAAWKRAKRDSERGQKRVEDEIEEVKLENLEERDVSIDPRDYENIPSSGAYITIKETKPGYRYYYWQWRDGKKWSNEYIAPVNPKSDSR